jgi:hypothetical protein
MRPGALAALVVLLLAASCSDGATTSPQPSPSGDPDLWRTDPSEPYAFVTPVPPLAPTPIDGTYRRDFRQGSDPIPCARCAPFRLDRGEATLELREGRYRVVQEASRFSSEGHYLVDGSRLILFNDPNCPDTRGLYTWSLDEGALKLQVVEDPCAFDLLRARYLAAAPWLAS